MLQSDFQIRLITGVFYFLHLHPTLSKQVLHSSFLCIWAEVSILLFCVIAVAHHLPIIKILISVHISRTAGGARWNYVNMAKTETRRKHTENRMGRKGVLVSHICGDSAAFCLDCLIFSFCCCSGCFTNRKMRLNNHYGPQRDTFDFYTLSTFQSLYFLTFTWVKKVESGLLLFFFYQSLFTHASVLLLEWKSVLLPPPQLIHQVQNIRLTCSFHHISILVQSVWEADNEKRS